ncbi:uncharacterized protein UTRI_03305 [Ustilago trichophora]|uniref:Uncharacterized protein n=1 Tax=Ustilago trichophora TaxID=86804 RepID=A0A5C3E722_9BASI|nr:uncharacterized protein UTRI_03305 [Ustilago trichophora]
MEHNFTHTPPPFLGTGFRQNHQIRLLKSNSYPYHTSHRSILPSSSHASPSLGLLTSTAPSFSRTNLTSHRRKHLRRCYDLLHLCIQRREMRVAAKFLRVILAAHEWGTSDGECWRLALLVLSLTPSSSSQDDEETHDQEANEATRRKISFLQSQDLDSSSFFKATHITSTLIHEYIACNRLNDAIELLEQRVNVHPYKSRPELHALLGMLYVFVGIQTLLNNISEGQEEGEERRRVNLRLLDRETRKKAKLCFEASLQAGESWVRGEVQKRQRVYGIFRRDQMDVEGRKLARRGQVWGLDPVGEDGENGWPAEEHKDLRKIRRKLERDANAADDVDEGEEGQEEEEEEDGESDAGSDIATSASGSVYTASSAASASSSSESESERRGRTRTRSQRSSVSGEPSTPPLQSEDSIPQPNKGPRAWARHWPEVSHIWTPTPPLACEMAKQFLNLLAPSNIPSEMKSKRRKGRDDLPDVEQDQDEENMGFGGVVQLTQEEAEARLRRILFERVEDQIDTNTNGGRQDRITRVKKEDARKRDRHSKEERRKRKRERYDNEPESFSKKRHRSEYPF